MESTKCVLAISNETVPETLVVLVHAIDPDTTGGGVYYRLRKIAYHYKVWFLCSSTAAVSQYAPRGSFIGVDYHGARPVLG